MSIEHSKPDDDSTRPVYEGDSPGPSRPDHEPTETERHVTAQEAAEVLGITVEAVRARMRRGTLRKKKASDGTVYVRLDLDRIQTGHDRSRPHDARTSERNRPEEDRTSDLSGPDASVVEVLREQIEVLRSELEDRKEEARRKDAIIMSLSQRFPELPPAAPREDPGTQKLTASEARDGSQAEAGEGEEPRRRSWLVRFFFGP